MRVNVSPHHLVGGMQMNDLNSVPDETGDSDSLNTDLVIISGGIEDTTVRPTREPFRSILARKYGIPLPPSPPSEPPAAEQK
jgi:hypothetical protein